MQSLNIKPGKAKGPKDPKGPKGSKGGKSAPREEESEKTQSQSDSPSDSLLPIRPAFGTNGRPVVVWANYFKIDAAEATLHKYALTVNEVLSDGKTIPVQKDGKPRPIRGRELQAVIAGVVEKIGVSKVVATEFKSQLVSLEKLDDVGGMMVGLVAYAEEGEETQTNYRVDFSSPIKVSLTSLINYLSSMEVAAWDMSYPKFPEAIDCLNIILGHKPRSILDDIAVVGSNKFFPFGSGRITQELGDRHNRFVQAARGMFQSARIGTGRLLLNTNVSHGVFKLDGKFKELFDQFGIKSAQRSDRGLTRAIATFGKFLPKTKVWIVSKKADGDLFRMTKALQGFAKASELSRHCDPDVARIATGWEYPGPKQIQFWNNDEQRLITLHDHYFAST